MVEKEAPNGKKPSLGRRHSALARRKRKRAWDEPFERTAGSPALAAAAQRRPSAANQRPYVRRMLLVLRRMFGQAVAQRAMGPLFWAALSLVVSVSLSIYGAWFVGAFPTSHDAPFIGVAVLILLFAFAFVLPLTAAIVTVTRYPVNEKYLGRLVQSYLTVLLLFANLYFVLTLLAPAETLPLAGIASPWTWRPASNAWFLESRAILLSAVDSVHFSCITITTVGYGDMHPVAWYAKLLADAEVLLGLGIAVIGLGRHFSPSNKPLQPASGEDVDARG